MKKSIKKFITLFSLCCVILFSAAFTVNAANGALQYFGVNFIMAGSEYSYNTKWWLSESKDENIYFLAIPHDAETIYADFDATGDVYLNGEKLENGQELAFVYGQEYSLACGNESYRLIALLGSDIPQIFINTDEPVDLYNKSTERSGQICILNNAGEYVYNGVLDEIKGRGNYTWELSKKPFNIKLDEKTDLFEMGKSKKYSLLANYIDVSLVKNKLICDFAAEIGVDFSSKSEIVDLYINNEYFGNYTLIERVEIDENRVDINNLEEQNEELNADMPPEDAPLGGERSDNAAYITGSYKYSELENNPDDITGGYLLEYELLGRYHKESSGFVSDYGQTIIVKSPEFASKEQVEYISNYYQEFEDAVLSDNGKNSLGKHYSEYLDVESMAKMYVLQEFVKNLDAGLTSFYMYKDIGGKLVAAPVWDFDSSLGRKYMRYDQNLADPEGLWVTGLPLHEMESENKKTIISLLCRHSDFRKLAAEQWETYFEPNIEKILATVDNMTAEIFNSAVIDRTRWNVINTDTNINDRVFWEYKSVLNVPEWYGESVKELKNFITVRRQFLDPMFDTDNSYMQYCGNGGDGVMYDYGYYTDGDIITVPECEFTNSDETKSFHGWNTKANGWGVQYMPGDEITVKDSVVLYAQWEEQSVIAKIASYISELFN